MKMRKCNSIIAISIIILLLVHLFMGGFIMMDIIQVAPVWKKVLSYTMATLLVMHIIIGIILTFKSINNTKKSRANYIKLNLKFWVVRISGFAIIILAIYHILFFINKGGEVIRLKLFGEFQLIASILFVVALLAHIIPNVRSMVISFGISNLRKFIRDIGIILLLALIFGLLAFIVYYFRWNVIWR